MPQTDFDPLAFAKSLLRAATHGALGTVTSPAGDPYCSLVNLATAADGAPLLLISELALHTQNILADSRVSLMLAEAGAGDRLRAARIMIGGSCRRIAAGAGRDAARRRYLARHPSAEMFADFKDFSFFRVEPASVHLVAGFGRIVDLAAPLVLTDLAGAESLVSAEADAVAHMNEDHADAVAHFATGLLKAEAGPWRITGIDPEGCDLALADTVLRLPFPHRVTSAAELRRVLVALTSEARGR